MLVQPASAHVDDENAPLRATFSFEPTVPTAGQPVRLRLDVRGRDGRPAEGVTVSAELFRGLSRTILPLRPEAQGIYSAEGTFPAGLWQGVIKLDTGDLTLFGDLSFRPADGRGNPGTRIAGARLDLRQGGVFIAAPWLDYVAWLSVLALLFAGSLAFAVGPRRRARAVDAVPPPVWARNAALAGALLGPAGAFWDVSWHVDRGRETFWSPPHLLIYGSVAAVLAAVAISVLRLPRGTRLTSLRARPGLLFALLATVVELGSAPFDELWHSLFGLDASIWAPPHLALLFGAGLSLLGLTLLEPSGSPRWRRTLLIAGAQLVMFIFVLEFEYRGMEGWHVLQARPSGLYPFWSVVLAVLTMAFASRLDDRPWTATAVTGCAWILRAGVSLAYLPALGLTAPALPPPVWLAAIVFDATRATLRGRGVVGFAAAGAAAAAAGLAAHAATQSLWSATRVSVSEFLGWAPVALLAASAAAHVGFYLGGLGGRGDSGAEQHRAGERGPSQHLRTLNA